MKIARSAVKHKDTVLNKTDIIVTEFEEQKFSLDNDFKDIEDLIVTSHLKKKTVFTQHNKYQGNEMVRECLDKKMYQSMVQWDGDEAPQESKHLKTE